MCEGPFERVIKWHSMRQGFAGGQSQPFPGGGGALATIENSWRNGGVTRYWKERLLKTTLG
jgi:hypothetical protein